MAPTIAIWLLARAALRLNAVAAHYGQPPLDNPVQLFDRASRCC
jgi:hypothetical protein